jgi:predicted NUDIX family phosphoesterase/thymidylate kinase
MRKDGRAHKSIRATLERLEYQIGQIVPQLSRKRRPFFIEFAGTPKSGKTTTLNALQQFLKRNGVRVRTFQERASVAPLTDKGTAFFNTWVTCATLNGMIEALEDEKLDVLILDRGLFDGLVWIDWQERTHRLSTAEAEVFRGFIQTPRWRDLIDLIIVMHCNPNASLQREHAKQITLRRGSIMNSTSLRQLQAHYLEAVKRYRPNFKRLEVFENTRGPEMKIIANIANLVLSALGKFSDEEVLCLPRKHLVAQVKFSDRKMVIPSWSAFSKLINSRGTYVKRSAAEQSEDLMQVVPVCVIRYGDKFLTNVRYEPGESLHDALGNWAGGHVRREDLSLVRSKWESVLEGLRRELHEEFSLEDLPNFKPLGIVHSSEDPRAARHLGIVFQIIFSDSVVAVALENKTIRERPDRYVRTSWMEKRDLSRTLEEQRDWSRAISSYLLQA